MVEMMDEIAVVLIPMAGLTGALCIAGGLEHLWEVRSGYAPAPVWWTRRYWRGVLCRVVCQLAEFEAAWEKRKIPRKAATSRGIVGQRVRRSACEYSKIIIDYGTNVKSEPQVFVDWRYTRG